MSEYIAETPRIGRDVCPVCEPAVDEIAEIVDVRYCDAHMPARDGCDDARVVADGSTLSGAAEMDPETCRAFAKLIR